MHDTYDEWGDFDPIEYVTRNYGALLPEDNAIITTVVHDLKRSGFANLEHVADIGTGPNFYPAMLLASLIGPGGEIDLIEFAKPNRDFINALLNDSDGVYSNRDKTGKSQSLDTRALWQKFDALIATAGQEERFQDTFRKARAASKAIAGNIYDLPESAYDFVSSYFVAESITNDKKECRRAFESLFSSVKPGGGFMVALMVGSNGWPAGEATHFPAVSLTVRDIQTMFERMSGISFHLTPIEEEQKVRAGYHGMAIVLGKRTHLSPNTRWHG